MKLDFPSWAMALLLVLMLGLPLAGQSQSVGIGTTTPDAKAALDIRATDKGLLVPRLTAAQRTGIAAPPQGLMVYQTDGTAGGGPGTGFWYFGGSPAAWVFINPAGGGADNLGNGVATTAVNLQGNALTGTGASIGAAVGLGVRADGGLNLGQNTVGNNFFAGYQAGAATAANVGTGEGVANHFVGYQAGAANTTGTDNHFAGYRAGAANTTGYLNHFVGNRAGQANTTGFQNLFVGTGSGAANTTGSNNLFAGPSSGAANTTGSYNQFVGVQAGRATTTGTENQFSGFQSGQANTTGNRNQFDGNASGLNNTTGSRNQFSGFGSGASNTTGSENIFVGYQSGFSNTTGGFNHFNGYQSGYSNTTGDLNVYCGHHSGYSYNGFSNSFFGFESGSNNLFGLGNIAFGRGAGPIVNSLTNSGAIGTFAQVSQSHSLVLGGTGNYAMRVAIGFTAPSFTLDVNGSIRCVGAVNTTSDARLKQAIRPLAGALAGVQRLRGVRYTFRQGEFKDLKLPAGEQMGLLAQEVEKVYPELVSTDNQGYKTINYAQLAPVLIEAIKEQQQQLDALHAQVAALHGPPPPAATDHAVLLHLQAQVARLLGEAPVAQARK